MASYHCSIKMLSRSSGRSSVQFSAYMSAEKMRDERLGKTFSHTSKEEVCFSEMLFADRVPEEIRNTEKFWNEVEAQEKQSNSQVARTWEIALPHELTIEHNQELAKEFAKSLLADGIPAVQFAVHKKQGNWHAHFMAPTRDFQNGKWQAKEKKSYALDEHGNKIPVLDGNGNQKFRDRKGKGREMLWERKTVKANQWNDRSYAKIWRERVAVQQNAALAKNGHDVRVDHRSYSEQGIEKIPTIHEGYQARKMEREGRISDRCLYNQDVAQDNRLIAKITAQITILSQDLEAQKAKRQAEEQELARRMEEDRQALLIKSRHEDVQARLKSDHLLDGFKIVYDRQMHFSPPKKADGITARHLKKAGYNDVDQYIICKAFNGFLVSCKASAKEAGMLISTFVEERHMRDSELFQRHLADAIIGMIKPDKLVKAIMHLDDQDAGMVLGSLCKILSDMPKINAPDQQKNWSR